MHGLKKCHGGDLGADLADATVERLDELLERVSDAFVGTHEVLLLGPEEGPGRGVNPASPLPSEEPAARQAEPHGMEFGVDARSGLGAEASQAGPMPNEGGLLALLDGFAVDLGDEVDDAHTGEQRGIDGVVLVVGLGDGPQPLRVGEDDVDARAVEMIEEPRPHAAGLDDHFEGLTGLEELGEARGLGPPGVERSLISWRIQRTSLFAGRPSAL